MNIYYVYQLRRADSALPFYIGKGKTNRLDMHFYPSVLKSKSIKNSYIKKAMNEGVEVLREKLKENMTEADAFAMEVALIKEYGRVDISTGFLANMSDGGDGNSGRIVTKEAAEKTAAPQRGRKKSEEHKAAIANSLKGRKVSEETKRKMSAAKLGRKRAIP